MAKCFITTDGWVGFHCPGCDDGHGVTASRWEFNGNLDAPTIRPSILVYAHKSLPPFKDQPRCHSFVTDGNIQFLPDCEHNLAGQTVSLPEWE